MFIAVKAVSLLSTLMDVQVCASSSVAFPRSFLSPNSGSVRERWKTHGHEDGTGPSSEDNYRGLRMISSKVKRR
jgi:hypothetical protein